MSPTVIVGLDGSPESRAAAAWAAREALRWGATLDLLQVHDVGPYVTSPAVDDQLERDWAERDVREAREDLLRRHPGLRAGVRLLYGTPTEELAGVTADADLLVLGSRGLGSVLGFLVGSVALPTVSYARCPVVLVRAGTPAAGAGAPPETAPTGATATATATEGGDTRGEANDVVLGMKPELPVGELLTFAFGAAARSSATLRVLHGFDLPPTFGVRPIVMPPGTADELAEEKAEALSAALRPWRERYPEVGVDCRAVVGRAARQLVAASPEAALVVVGRRVRRSPVGAHIGSVAHAVLHHAQAPVAVVPHG